MENTNMINEAILHTPIQAATRLGKAPQYLYGLLRNGKIPQEHIHMMIVGDKARELLKESFFEWFASRPVTRTSEVGPNGTVTKKVKASKVEIRQMTADELFIAMAAKLEAVDNKKFKGLVEALRTVIPAGPESAPQNDDAAAANA